MRTRIAGGSLFHAASFLLRNSSAFNWLKPYNKKELYQKVQLFVKVLCISDHKTCPNVVALKGIGCRACLMLLFCLILYLYRLPSLLMTPFKPTVHIGCSIQYIRHGYYSWINNVANDVVIDYHFPHPPRILWLQVKERIPLRKRI